VKNTSRVKFGILGKGTVTQIPEYAAPTPENEAAATQSELPAVSAIPYKPVDHNNPHFWEHSEEGGRVLAREAKARARTKDCVGTDAFVRPGREATVPPAGANTTPNVVSSPSAVPPHDFKESQPAPAAQSRTTGTTADATRKKTPASVTTPAPQERKIAAHRGG
jgi:hypothetical protein